MSKKEEGPDQARSWAIAMAGCVINSLMSGISRTTGLFYVALIETYGVSRMEANMPFTMRNVVRNLASPVAGAIGQRYGARDVTFVGGIFACLGISLCCFAPSVLWISVMWGGMHAIAWDMWIQRQRACSWLRQSVFRRFTNQQFRKKSRIPVPKFSSDESDFDDDERWKTLR